VRIALLVERKRWEPSERQKQRGGADRVLIIKEEKCSGSIKGKG